MSRQGEDAYQRIYPVTIDGCQGEQYDLVVADYAIAGALDTLSDLRRLIVPLTRAVNALVVLSSTEKLAKHEVENRALRFYTLHDIAVVELA